MAFRVTGVWFFPRYGFSLRCITRHCFFGFSACRPAARHFFAWSDERRRTAYAIKRRQLRDLSRLSSRLGGRSARSERVCPVRLAALLVFAKVHHSALFFGFFACCHAARHFLHGLCPAARLVFSHGLTNAAARLMLFASELPSSLCCEC